MKNFSDILKQFTIAQRLLVLILLLVFTSSTFIITTYINSDKHNCIELVKTNERLLSTLSQVYNMILDEKQKNLNPIMLDSSITLGDDETSTILIEESNSEVLMDSVLNVINHSLKTE